MMYYTLLSAGITACIDFLFLFITARIMCLIQEASRAASGIPEAAMESGMENFRAAMQSSAPGENVMSGQPGNYGSGSFPSRGLKLFGQSFHWGDPFADHFYFYRYFRCYLSFSDPEDDPLY